MEDDKSTLKASASASPDDVIRESQRARTRLNDVILDESSSSTLIEL
jgi:hypothetical protein